MTSVTTSLRLSPQPQTGGANGAVTFDPDEAEIGRILDNFERLAKKWTPKPRKPKAVPEHL